MDEYRIGSAVAPNVVRTYGDSPATLRRQAPPQMNITLVAADEPPGMGPCQLDRLNPISASAEKRPRYLAHHVNIDRRPSPAKVSADQRTPPACLN